MKLLDDSQQHDVIVQDRKCGITMCSWIYSLKLKRQEILNQAGISPQPKWNMMWRLAPLII